MNELTTFFDDDSVEVDERDERETVTNSKMKKYPLTDIAQNEWKTFAMYSIESRAIPNMIDGLKPVNRFFLYSSLKNSKTEFKKVSAISGVLSGYGYNHGEVSAASAGQLMAAEWANNIRLIHGRGSFGTRLVNDAAAARYTYTKLHDNFEKYIKDIDLAPVHSDPEHEPPAFYVPVIPLVLANGIRGIGTGFATNILPRDPVDLVRATKEYVETGSIDKKVKLKFPDFTGLVTYDPVENRYVTHGTFTRRGKTVVVITEVPFGHDRESYIKILDKLEESGDIVGYDDQCNKDGFQFEVKLKQSNSNWTDDKLVQQFKLTKVYTENLTVIDFDGKLREYSDERDLIKDFCDYRNTILRQRIDLRQKEYVEEVRWLTVKMQFIQSVLDDKIKFKGQKKEAVFSQILSETDALNHDCDRLLRLNIMTLTDEMVRQLEKEIADATKNLKFWKKTTVKDQFLSDLNEI